MKIKFQNGSALLLAFLIMTAILSSVLYVARLSLRQISQSKSVDNANIAFYAAESGNEQAIYYIRKESALGFDFLNILTPKVFQGDSSVNDASITRTVLDTAESINMGLKKNQFFQFDLFDPEKMGKKSNLSYLEISWEDNCSTHDSPNSSWIELTANEWDSSDSEYITWDSDTRASHHVLKSLFNLPPYVGENIIEEIGGQDINPEKVYQFRIKALFCDIYNLSIKAFNKDLVTGDIKQLSFRNIYVIKTVGQYPGNSEKGNKQALSVSLRSMDPLSGLFDYVIFSEQSLIKDF